MRAWERADVAALVELLAEDAWFTMPPLPAWFRGQENIGRFFADRMFPTPWRLVPLGRTGSRRSLGTRGMRLATASGWPGSTCWAFAQVGSPGSPASSTLTCIGISGCPRNCLEVIPARSDEFRRGRVSQWSIAVTPVSDPSGRAPAILIGRVVWAAAERKQRNDPERGRS
jgi:hypothetical protein